MRLSEGNLFTTCANPQAHNQKSQPSKPLWDRSFSYKGRSSPARGYKSGCVCSYMAGVISHQRSDWPYRNKHTQTCTLSLGMTALWPYSTGAVQIRLWVWSSLTTRDFQGRRGRININNFVWWLPRWRGGSPDRVAMGSNVCVLCADPKEHKHLRPGARPGVSVTGVTEKLFICQTFMYLFWPLVSRQIARESSPERSGKSLTVSLWYLFCSQVSASRGLKNPLSQVTWRPEGLLRGYREREAQRGRVWCHWTSGPRVFRLRQLASQIFASPFAGRVRDREVEWKGGEGWAEGWVGQTGEFTFMVGRAFSIPILWR